MVIDSNSMYFVMELHAPKFVTIFPTTSSCFGCLTMGGDSLLLPYGSIRTREPISYDHIVNVLTLLIMPILQSIFFGRDSCCYYWGCLIVATNSEFDEEDRL